MLLRAPSHDRAPRPASSQIQKKAKPRGAQGGATCKVVADVGTIGSRVIKRQAHQSIECALWRRRCDQLHAVPRRFSRGFDGVPRDCAIHSEKQRSGANRSEAGGGSAPGFELSPRCQGRAPRSRPPVGIRVGFVEIVSTASVDCWLDGQGCALPTIPRSPSAAALLKTDRLASPPTKLQRSAASEMLTKPSMRASRSAANASRYRHEN